MSCIAFPKLTDPQFAALSDAQFAAMPDECLVGLLYVIPRGAVYSPGTMAGETYATGTRIGAAYLPGPRIGEVQQ